MGTVIYGKMIHQGLDKKTNDLLSYFTCLKIVHNLLCLRKSLDEKTQLSVATGPGNQEEWKWSGIF